MAQNSEPYIIANGESQIVKLSDSGADIRIAIFLQPETTATVTIEATPNALNSVDALATAEWFPVSEDLTAWEIAGNSTANIYFPVKGIRISNDMASAGAVDAYVIQSGPF